MFYLISCIYAIYTYTHIHIYTYTHTPLSMNEQGVVNSIHGLSAMGAKWAGLSKGLRVALNDALTLVSPHMGEQGVSMTVLALAKLEVCWVDELCENLQNALRRAIIRQPDLGEHALSNLLYGLGKLDREWEQLHPEVRQVLKAGIVMCHLRDRCTSQVGVRIT
jgi:hypothetical protein